MKFTKQLVLAALCSTAMSTPAFAQDGAAEETDDSVIIVTAQRRAQDVQDIPLAVTAVSPVQLERQGVVNVTQISQVSASFSTSNAQNTAGTNVLRIRGVGTTSNNIGFESAVGIFIDGAYQSRPGVALSEFVDVERVEVLRGPQGTLFGRNTSAGALNITTKRPDLNEFGGFVNASYGNYDLISVQGAVNAPLIQDTLALRVTGAYRQRDGFVRVVDATGTVGRSNEIDQFLVRGQLGYESDSGFTVRLIGDYSEINGNCCAPVELLRSPLETGGVFAASGLGATGGNFQPNGSTSPFDTTAAETALDDRIASQSFVPTNAIDQWGITGEIDFPISDSADIIYIGSYREFNASNTSDSDFTALDLFNVGTAVGPVPNGTSIDTMTHELRIQGEAFDGALDWLVGAYYSDEDIDQVATSTLGTQWDQFVGALLQGSAGPAPIALFSGGLNPAGTSSTNRFTQSSQSWSIFTHNTLEVAEGLKLTLGLRYSDETKDGGFEQLASNPGACGGIVNNVAGGPLAPGQPRIPGALVPTLLITGCFPFVAPADLAASAVLPLPRTFNGTFKDNELIYTGKVSYEFASPINVYASFTHGYKSGGFNLDTTAAIGGADPRFASEEVDAYEIGFKGKFLDNAVTLNVAAFIEEFSNFQVLEFTGAQFQTFNVPKAESVGVEIETVIRPSDHFTINGGLTIVDAKYPGDCATAANPLRVQNLCNAPLTNAPKYVGIMGATYKNTIGDSLNFFLNGQIRMESDRRTSTQPSTPPTTAAALGNTPLLPFDVQDGNIKVNLRAGIGDAEDAWGLEFWVTNLTNEVTRGVTFSTTLRSGSRSAFPQEPRMFGVTARGKF
ncbi:TonB-dependent receptor domain-containing protein [Sphingorhabdus sp. Alg231-15]|uniref:TonB-dependent receptor domain-containing protein n=1 Tax=Sphingorhabdus sp. Alg231-15 TaxID=1922222 RepID=UPI000D55AA50